jgi:hypothetical protein
MAGKLKRISSLLLLSSLAASGWPQSLDYRAPLQPVNPGITEAGLTGEVRLVMFGDELRITVETEGLAPDMMHLQHLHGSRDGMDAECAPAGLRTEQDDITDLLDTRPYSGITLIPLHDDPASLAIKSDAYPVSNRAGAYTYTQAVNRDELQRAVADEYGIDDIELGRMVVYIHGVAEDTNLPDTVRSLPGVPAHITLPVACAELDIQPVHK